MITDRREAGILLSEKLIKYKNDKKAIVLAILRGGLVVGREISKELEIDLYPLIILKLSAPSNSELAIGALTQQNIKYIDRGNALYSRADEDYLAKEVELKKNELIKRYKKYQIQSKYSDLNRYNTFIITDDGVATGATMMAALKYLKETVNYKTGQYNSGRGIILAVPVISQEVFDKIKPEVDNLIALKVETGFSAVGQFYQDFPQVTDEEVINILKNEEQRT